MKEDAILEISAAVNDTTEKVIDISSVMDDITKQQDKNNKNINEIKKALSLIKHVSTQTNMLGLNALIEAAHAGEHGRGFSIIAEEVRKLAVQVVEQEKEINSIVEKIIVDSNKTTKDISRMASDITKVAANLEEINSELEELGRD